MRKVELNVKSVLFDMDGVITNTMPDHFKAWKTVLREEGIPVTRYDVYIREGQRGSTSVREICAAHNRDCDAKKAKRILNKKELLFKRIVRTKFIPGARNFLKYLRHRNFELALVTGTSRHELKEILPDQIYNLFSVTVTGSDVKNGKPDPEPYKLALRKLELRPESAIVIENAPLGIQAARAAGIKCLAIETSLARHHLQKAEYIFSSFRELRDKITFSSQ